MLRAGDVLKRKTNGELFRVLSAVGSTFHGISDETGEKLHNQERGDYIRISKKSSLENQFNVGDIVRLKSGTSPIIVTKAYTLGIPHVPVIDGEYARSDNKLQRRLQTDFVPYEEEKEEEEEEEIMRTSQPQLYEVPPLTGDKPRFGTYMATTSRGELVIEVEGKAESFDPKKVKKVLPWTYTVRWRDGTTQTYRGPENCVMVGDIVANCIPNFGIVTKTNTETGDMNIQELDGQRIPTEKISKLINGENL